MVANETLACAKCNTSYPVANGKIYFVTPPEHNTRSSNIKHKLRKILGRRYNDAVRLLGPGFPINKRRLLLDQINPSTNLVVDLGSGTERVAPGVVTVDLFDYPEVDIVCDLRYLPFQRESVDGFMTTSVLEHLEHPDRLLEKIFDCTRPGGIGVHSFPFLFPFHEAPGDFTRYTHAGAAILFARWTVKKLFNVTGPISALNTVAVEFASTLLSCGNGKIKEGMYLVFGAMLSPLKYLDAFFVDKASFLSVSAMLCAVVEKPSRN